MTETIRSGATAGAVEDIVELLRAGTGFDLTVEDGPHHDLLDHSLQTAQALLECRPQDIELQLAGLVHDIGHLLPPRRDEVHAEVAAEFIRPVLGGRIAGLVRLHVPAKRYLVTSDPGYRAELDEGSIISLERQGGNMSGPEIRNFVGHPQSDDAVVLRRADEAGKVPGKVVPGLDAWVAALRSHSFRP